MEVQDWGDLTEGMLVDARVTGHNTGGLECEVNHMRGFIPVSQIALYRVEDLRSSSSEKFTCLVTEANPERRNLVLSRRAVLEREKEEARQQLLESLRPGQVHEGVVRKILDFGAFVDMAASTGCCTSASSPGAVVEHPSEVLSEGQTIKVKIDKIDPENRARSASAIATCSKTPGPTRPSEYPANSVVRGTVTKLMEFGAFVELEPGVEGLIHISELSHKRVWRASDVVHKGDQVEVLVLSVDTDTQRISLSMKACCPSRSRRRRKATPKRTPCPRSRPSTRAPSFRCVVAWAERPPRSDSG